MPLTPKDRHIGSLPARVAVAAIVPYSSGSPQCQDVVRSCVLDWWLAGQGIDCSEVLTLGFGSAALDCRVAPTCPPGLVTAAFVASWSICR
jgi:hypothetical protein